MGTICVALLGDYRPGVTAYQAIPRALDLAARDLGLPREHGALSAMGRDPGGEVSAVELSGHPFFVATLFQPERAALRGVSPPLVKAFAEACAVAATERTPI